MKVLCKKSARAESSNYRGTAMLHASKVLLKAAAYQLSEYFEEKGILPEETHGFRPLRSTIDVLLAKQLLKEHELKRGIPLFLYAIDLQLALDVFDRDLLWGVLARFGVP